MSSFNYLIVLTTLVVQNYGSKILAVFPAPSISHQVVFRPLILELVNRGHEVTLLTPDPMFKKGHGPANLTEIDVHDLSYNAYKEIIKHGEITTGNKNNLQEQMKAIFRLMENVIERQLLTNEMQNILKDKTKTFDLLLLEAFVSRLLVLTHVYKNVPVIQVSSFGPVTENLKAVGAPIHPLIYPTSLQQKIYNLSVWDKITELYNKHVVESTVKSVEDNSNEIFKQILGEDLPDCSDLQNNVDMLFLNVYPVWDMNRPTPPNVIYMGGLHQQPEKELPKDLKNYLDSSKNGVIYVSFGTNVEPGILPSEKIQAMVNAFSKTPYDILWKWNRDELPGKTDNIKIYKWLPQSDLLKHPNIKLFITQGGLQSTDEAITAGVPLIGIPMLGDQWYNVEQYVHHKIGLKVDMDTITDKSLGDAIDTVLGDRSFRDNTIRLRTLMRDQPQTPLERAIWWTEYVLRHKGAKHLRSPAANMSWREYWELDLVFLLVFAVLYLVASICVILFCIYSSLMRRRTSMKLKTR